MRCDSCQKFVSFDTDTEPELQGLSVDDDGNVSGSVRIVNNCAECGQELAESYLDVEMTFDDLIGDHRDEAKSAHEIEQAAKPEDEREPYDETAHDTLSVESEEASRSDRRQTHDRHGKPIRNSRYQRQYYGAEVSVTIACKCGESFSRSEVFEAQASGMDSLV